MLVEILFRVGEVPREGFLNALCVAAYEERFPHDIGRKYAQFTAASSVTERCTSQ